MVKKPSAKKGIRGGKPRMAELALILLLVAIATLVILSLVPEVAMVTVGYVLLALFWVFILAICLVAIIGPSRKE